MRKILVSSPHSILAAGGVSRAISQDLEAAGDSCDRVPPLRELADGPGVQTSSEPSAARSRVTERKVSAPSARSGTCNHRIALVSSLWVDWISLEFVREAIQIGVRGILRKDAPTAQYIQCLDYVAAGQLWLERDLSERLLNARTIRLSPRERQLVALLTEGLRNKEIAGRMNITEGTAKAYLSRLFEKTGARATDSSWPYSR